MSTVFAVCLIAFGIITAPMIVFYSLFRIGEAVRGDSRRSQTADDWGSAHRIGLAQQTAAVLAYALGPLSGGLVLLLNRTHPFVRFHAAQAVLSGLFQAIVSYVAFFSLLALVMLPPVGWTLALVVGALFLTSSVMQWITMMVRAGRGLVWRDPLVGNWAWQIASRKGNGLLQVGDGYAPSPALP